MSLAPGVLGLKRGSWKVMENTLAGFGGEVDLVPGSTAADRQTGRQTGRKGDRQRDIQADRHTDIHTRGQTERHTQTDTASQPDGRTDGRTEPGLDLPAPAATCSWLRRVSAML